MKQRIICKALAVAVILLFIILGVKPAFAVTKYGNNNPPESPMINGPVGGKVGYEYEFFFSAVDPEGDNVSFYVEWGDGTNDGWSDYVESGLDKMYSHIWFKPNDYFIRCKAKDIYGKESSWTYLIFSISKNRACNFNILGLQLERFPLMEVLLRILNL